MTPTLFGPEVLDPDLPREVDVYTDGGCDPNPGPGGWAAIIVWQGREWVLSGSDPDTTNNRMELQAPAAALALLEGLLGRCQVCLYSDSEYLQRGMTEWLTGWVSRDWLTQDGQPVKNQDLWRLLHRLTQAHAVTWHWLKGHAGHAQQERADRLATDARRSLRRPVAGVATPAAPAAAIVPLEGTGTLPHALRGVEWPAVAISVKAMCCGARGTGGWGAVLRTGERSRHLSGSQPDTTVNAMLIRGAAEALQALKQPCRVTLCSDADYLIKGASTWAPGWQARGWQTKDGKPVANRAEWEALLKAAQPHLVTWIAARDGGAPEEDLVTAGQLAAEAVPAVGEPPGDGVQRANS